MAKNRGRAALKCLSLSVLAWSISACSNLEAASFVSPKQPIAPAILTEYSPSSDVSSAARATRPERPPEYDNVRSMLENADMSAFMEENRQFYADGDRSGSWGFAAIDMIVAGDAETALMLLDKMPAGDYAGQVMSPNWLRPWVLASTDQSDAALEAMEANWLQTPQHLYQGHRALLLEGMGQIEEAILAYEAPEAFDRPSDDEEPSVETVVRALTFGADRILALRKANLLEKLKRYDEAEGVYLGLLDVDPTDAYVEQRLETLGEEDETEAAEFLSLDEALAMALNDEASALEEKQMLASVLLAKGAEAPFNHFISALRQSALLLDPENASVRELEVDHLYEHGFFEAAARMALVVSDDPDAELQLAAAEAKLELGQFDEAESLVEQALSRSETAFTRLQAVEVFIRADAADRATQMADMVLDDSELDDGLRVYALMLRAEARQQAGDIKGAIAAAREALKLDVDDENAKAFLASMLTLTVEARDEGLAIYRELMANAPNNASMMNNYGYSLVQSPGDREQLDAGYRLLKRANRQTPFEPNLLDSLGWAYYQYGDYRRARRMIEKAIEGYAPFSHWELFDHLGDVQWRLGETDLAVQNWEKALDARPPRLDRSRIDAKVADGLTTPAPEKRTPPLVPKDEPVETTDI